jgi:ABC-type sugar transport system ATPase subunit
MIGTENIWLRVAKISKHFGPVIALEAVEASVRLGEVLALVGDNGARNSRWSKI